MKYLTCFLVGLLVSCAWPATTQPEPRRVPAFVEIVNKQSDDRMARQGFHKCPTCKGSGWVR